MAGQAVSVDPYADGSIAEAWRPQVAAFAKKRKDGLYEVELMVRGLHCAACIQKVESSARDREGVVEARLNFSTGRLRMAWQGVPDVANDVTTALIAQGYEVSAYDPAKMNEDMDRERRLLLLCMGVAGFAAGNIMLLSFALWTTSLETMGVATRDFIHWISAVIAIPAIGFSGRPFFRSAWAALSSARTNMDVPISVAMILATGMSLFQLFVHAEDAYFDSAVMLMFFLLVGRFLDFQARARARGAAGDLLAMMGGVATVIDGAEVRSIPVSSLREAMVVIVAMGERIPADGVIIGGHSEIDFSLVTGESIPQAVSEGMRVTSGAMNISAPLTIRMEKTADDSFLADIVRLMEKAEQSQSLYVRMADRVARLYAPAVHILALLAFIFWYFIGGADGQEALLIAVTVLIITCPCALGLAVPVVQVLAVGRLMKQGIMVKAGDALERLATINTVFFDKTGTITRGQPIFKGMINGSNTDFLLAASIAVGSRHPLSRALLKACAEPVIHLSDIREYPGQGLEAVYNGEILRLGKASWCGAEDDVQPSLRVYFRRGSNPPCVFLFEDAVRTDARETIAALKARGLAVQMLSGDRELVARAVAGFVGIDNIHADMAPADKVRVLESERGDGAKILMVGDGLNDAPVIAAADVSMSPSTAIDISQNAADIVFTGDSLSKILMAHDVARKAQLLVKQNFMLSIAYNVVAIPLAFAGMVNPLVAAAAMSLSSLVVILNSFRLRGSL
jgi:Cu2+-exporting ATPase